MQITLLEDEVVAVYKELPHLLTLMDVVQKVFLRRIEKHLPPDLRKKAYERGALHPLWPRTIPIYKALLELGYVEISHTARR